MIHLVLDTNVYRSNPSMDNLHFKAIEKLAIAGELKLHIPYVVLREFQTQQRENYSKDLAKAISGLSGLTKKSLDKAISAKLLALKSDLENNSQNILSNEALPQTDESWLVLTGVGRGSAAAGMVKLPRRYSIAGRSDPIKVKK